VYFPKDILLIIQTQRRFSSKEVCLRVAGMALHKLLLIKELFAQQSLLI